jgi:hypothetical protein
VEGQQNQDAVQQLLLQLARAQITAELVKRTTEKLTDEQYAAFGQSVFDHLTKTMATSSFGFSDIERQFQQAFFESPAWKEICEKLEPLVIKAVQEELGRRIDMIARDISSNWMRSVLNKIQKSFDEWMQSHYR